MAMPLAMARQISSTPSGTAIAAQNPDDAFLAVALAEELAVGLGGSGGEDRLVVARILDHPAPPGGQQADVDPVAVGLVDDVVDVIPVVVFGGVGRVAPGVTAGCVGSLSMSGSLP